MRLATLLLANAAASAAYVVAGTDQAPLNDDANKPEEKFLIELGPDELRWVTEDEKWEIRRSGRMFFDITDDSYFGHDPVPTKQATFPSKPSHNSSIAPLLPLLSEEHMRDNLEKFSSFHTRYYKSEYGAQSSAWLLNRVNDTLNATGALEHGASVRHFEHPWGQHSIIATLPGNTNKTVVIGAHQDSINLFLPSILAAPGADDDGSGTVTILEAMRVLLSNSSHILSSGNMTNTLEFHWYSAEEGGLLGSQAIFSNYSREGRDVRAMLQQDMTGYVQGTLDAGEPESVGVITDYVSAPLTDFIKKIVNTYCSIGYVETRCGYACSDHASASKAGFPSAFVIESDFKRSDKRIHTTDDKLEYLSFSHMLQHARLTLGLAWELAMADFD
ncbi:MAG: Leucine aminopeptidase 1 [Bathelium mastoideum]|nr:MAG: Leucine aminopeptidase 1 [Bathelium mastoideum]KAI9692974.1 MAG: Leucine aminopeptidase 1 [Bathelium mastoideum]